MSKKNIMLACTECRMKNYKVAKSITERLQIKKFCRRCNAHTLHKEEK